MLTTAFPYVVSGQTKIFDISRLGNYLTPNRPVAHTSFTYRKLNMDVFSVLDGSLGYVDSTQEVEWNSLHAQSLFQKAFFTS